MSRPRSGEALVGPNAVTQLAPVLERRLGAEAAAALFAQAGLAHHWVAPPQAMVPEAEAAALHRVLWSALPSLEAQAAAFEAGWATGGYLLTHRIPKFVQGLLRLSSPRLAAFLLLRAIAAHAWTFVGSGRLSARAGAICLIEIAANPLAAARCAWHRGVFLRLFRALVSARSSVVETACCAAGAPACRFEISLGGSGRGCATCEPVLTLP